MKTSRTIVVLLALLMAASAQAGSLTINFCNNDPNTVVAGVANWNVDTKVMTGAPEGMTGTVTGWNDSEFQGYYIQNNTPDKFKEATRPENPVLFPANSLQYGGWMSADGCGLGVSGIPAAWSTNESPLTIEILGGGFAHNRADSVPTWQVMGTFKDGSTAWASGAHGNANYAIRLTSAAIPDDKAAAEKAAAEKVDAAKAIAEKAATETAPADKAASEKADAEKAAAEKAAADKADAEKAAADKAAADAPKPAGEGNPTPPDATVP